MSTRNINLRIFFLFFLFSSQINALENLDFELDEDDIKFNELFNTTEFDELDAFRNNDCLTPDEILALLLGSPNLNLALLLRSDIYLRTNPVVVRNIVDSPILGRTRLHDEDFIFQTDFFYQHMEHGYFTRRSKFIDSIINFNNQDLLNILPTIENLFNIQGVEQALAVFRNTKIQERQTGAMFSVAGNYHFWHLSGRIPLYWVEHNFYLTQLEQNSVENTPLIDSNAISEEEREEAIAFFTRRLVADRLGLGDTRLKLEHLFHSTPHLQAYAGLSLTIPTAVTLARGLIGGKFSKPFGRPAFSISQVINLILCDRDIAQATDIGLDFVEGALCQLTSNVADRGLGNGGHWGFAPTIDIYNRIEERLCLELYAAIEYLAASNERRYFIEKKNIDRLNMIATDFATFTEEQDEAALIFLNEQLINTFYPFVIETRVRPGVILKVRPAVHMEVGRFSGWIGYDFWWQAEESLLELHGPAHLVDRLRVDHGRKQRAEQHRLWFDARWYMLSSEHFDWQFTLKADETIRSLGIGQSFAISFGIQGSF